MQQEQIIAAAPEKAGGGLLTGHWEHIFLEGGTERKRECRIVFDLDRNEVTRMDVRVGHKWRESDLAQRQDVTDSIVNANAECLDAPEDWDLEATDSLPQWAL